MKSVQAESGFVRAALQINFLISLLYAIPMSFVGFALLRLAAISLAKESTFIDARIAVPLMFIIASLFAWIGWGVSFISLGSN